MRVAEGWMSVLILCHWKAPLAFNPDFHHQSRAKESEQPSLLVPEESPSGEVFLGLMQ